MRPCMVMKMGRIHFFALEDDSKPRVPNRCRAWLLSLLRAEVRWAQPKGSQVADSDAQQHYSTGRCIARLRARAAVGTLSHRAHRH